MFLKSLIIIHHLNIIKDIDENSLPTSHSIMKYEIFLKTIEQGIWTPTDWKWTLYNDNKQVPDSIKSRILKNS